MTDLTRSLAEYAKLDARKKELKSELEMITRELTELEAELLPEMAESGIQNLKVSDGNGGFRTVYIKRQVWAGHNGDKQALCQALKEAGLDEYVQPNFNSNQLSAWVREFDPDRNLTENEILERIPKPIAEHLKVTEKFNLTTTKS